MRVFGAIIWHLIGLGTAIIGHSMHGSLFWAIIDFFFWPFVWFFWLILQKVNITIITQAFEFFLQ